MSPVLFKLFEPYFERAAALIFSTTTQATDDHKQPPPAVKLQVHSNNLWLGFKSSGYMPGWLFTGRCSITQHDYHTKVQRHCCPATTATTTHPRLAATQRRSVQQYTRSLSCTLVLNRQQPPQHTLSKNLTRNTRLHTRHKIGPDKQGRTTLQPPYYCFPAAASSLYTDLARASTSFRNSACTRCA